MLSKIVDFFSSEKGRAVSILVSITASALIAYNHYLQIKKIKQDETR